MTIPDLVERVVSYLLPYPNSRRTGVIYGSLERDRPLSESPPPTRIATERASPWENVLPTARTFIVYSSGNGSIYGIMERNRMQSDSPPPQKY